MIRRAHRPRQPAGRSRGGFTLIELLAVVVMTGLVLTTAVGFYVQTAQASDRAAERGARSRRAAIVLDRVARDLEGATLLTRPDGVDALSHPWVFLAESGPGGGAERVKFQTRAHRPDGDAPGESDLAVVAYWLVPSEDGESRTLLRWSSPVLGPALDRSFPRLDDPGVQLLAEPVAEFGVRLLDGNGSWSESWDSSTLARSNQLPEAAEILIAWPPLDAEGALQRFSRRVALPVPPLDLQGLLDAAAGAADEQAQEDEEGEDCVTVAQCIERNSTAFEIFLAARPDRPEVEAVIDSIRDQCYVDHAASLGISVENCE